MEKYSEMLKYVDFWTNDSKLFETDPIKGRELRKISFS